MKLVYDFDGCNLNKNKKKEAQLLYKCNNKIQTLRAVMAEYLNSVERLHIIILYK